MKRSMVATGILVPSFILGLILMAISKEGFWAGLLSIGFGLVLSIVAALSWRDRPINGYQETYYVDYQNSQDREWLTRQGLYHDVREIRRKTK